MMGTVIPVVLERLIRNYCSNEKSPFNSENSLLQVDSGDMSLTQYTLLLIVLD